VTLTGGPPGEQNFTPLSQHSAVADPVCVSPHAPAGTHACTPERKQGGKHEVFAEAELPVVAAPVPEEPRLCEPDPCLLLLPQPASAAQRSAASVRTAPNSSFVPIRGSQPLLDLAINAG